MTGLIDLSSLIGRTITEATGTESTFTLHLDDGTEVEAVAWWDSMNDKGGLSVIVEKPSGPAA